MKFLYNLTLVSLVLFLATSCKDDPEPVNPEEIITTLNLYLTPDGGGSDVTFTFQDLDGDGANAPVITNGTLAANTNYTARVEFLNESEDPAEDITEEVKEEDLDHQVFYQVAAGLNLQIAYNDQDSAGNPLGVATTAAAGDASTGTLTITLRHEPDKAASGVADGDISNAGGESDIEVTFDVTIQ